MELEHGGARRRTRRSGGRSANLRGSGPAIRQLPWEIPVNSDAPTEPLTAEQVQAVHDGAMRVLEEIGVEFLHEEARDVLKAAGCETTPGSTNVRMDRGLVMEKVGLAPSQFTITPRNPGRAVTIGGRHMVFVNVSSPPNCSDLDRGRRVGDRESYRDLLKLTQYFNCIHMAGGYPVEPIDLHPSVRHLDCLYDKLTLTDKAVHAYSLGAERIEDVMEMTRIAGGLTHEEFDAAPRMYTNINSSSPLKHDLPMLDGAMRLARRGQPTIVTPFTLAGAMAPVTLAGAVTQFVAEGLSAIVLLQCIKPGVPCAIGSFTSNVDMRTGAPAFGTPEYIRATQISGQMARFYGLPLRRLQRVRRELPRRAGRVGERVLSLGVCGGGALDLSRAVASTHSNSALWSERFAPTMKRRSSAFKCLMCGPFEASPSSTTTSFRCGCSRRTSLSSRFAALRSQSFFFAPSPFTIGSGAKGKTSRCSGCTSTAPSIW